MVHLIDQMLSRGANPEFAGAQIVKHCAQLDSIGDSAPFYSGALCSVLLCSVLQLGALLFLPDFQTYFPPSGLSTNPATALWPPFCQNPFSGVTVENLLTEEGSVKRGPSVIITVREWGKNWLGLK